MHVATTRGEASEDGSGAARSSASAMATRVGALLLQSPLGAASSKGGQLLTAAAAAVASQVRASAAWGVQSSQGVLGCWTHGLNSHKSSRDP